MKGAMMILFCAVLGPSAAHAVPRAPFEYPAQKYTQELEIVFKTSQAAQKASIEMLPLYDGFEWAISCRWDDNNPISLKMHKLLAKYGLKATWYLNDPRRGRGFPEAARELLSGGHSIGGHGLTHPVLPGCSRNRIFEEIAAVRIAWESTLDTPVLSYAFSFTKFRNYTEGDAMHIDIARALERAGYYNIPNANFGRQVHTDMILSPIMPDDGEEIDGFVRRSLKNKKFKKTHPNLSFAMHPLAYERNNLWDKLAGQFAKYANNPEWWYCNQNQYAAYRYQYLYSKVSAAKSEGEVIRVRLERPVLVELNDPTPLTFRINGVNREDIAEVRCATADHAVSDRKTDQFVFHLFHDRDQGLPGKIALIANEENRSQIGNQDRDPDFPKINALLHFEKENLRLTITNGGTEPLKKVRVTYRLPLAWKDGVIRHKLHHLAPAAQKQDTLALSLASDEYKYNSGFGYFVAQIDFVRGKEAGRIYATTRVKNEQLDRSYPQGGFVKLGPIQSRQFDLGKLESTVRVDQQFAKPWVLESGVSIGWKRGDGTFRYPFLDPEIVRTSGAWRSTKSEWYLLRSTVHSEVDQDVTLRFKEVNTERVFLNGENVTDGSAKLRKGPNHLVVAYCTTYKRRRGYKYNTENAGWYLRVVNPQTNERVKNIRFEAPTLSKG